MHRSARSLSLLCSVSQLDVGGRSCVDSTVCWASSVRFPLSSLRNWCFPFAQISVLSSRNLNDASPQAALERCPSPEHCTRKNSILKTIAFVATRWISQITLFLLRVKFLSTLCKWIVYHYNCSVLCRFKSFRCLDFQGSVLNDLLAVLQPAYPDVAMGYDPMHQVSGL